jgi:hypothetical protein
LKRVTDGDRTRGLRSHNPVHANPVGSSGGSSRNRIEATGTEAGPQSQSRFPFV